MNNKILVLSATGNVGLPLVNVLMKNNNKVKAASRSGKNIDGAEGVRFDFSAPESYAPAFNDAQSVYIMLPTGYAGGVKTLIPIIDLAAERGAKIVLQTAIEAAFDNSNPYINIEEHLKKSGASYVIVRPTWFMDNFHIFWTDRIKKGDLRLPTENGKTAFIDTRDIADCGLAALSSNQFDGMTFNLTGKEALSYKEAVDVFSKVLGRTITYTSISDEEYIEQLVNSGIPRVNAVFFTHALSEVRKGLVAEVYDDVEKLTGKPPRSLNDYVIDNQEKFTA